MRVHAPSPRFCRAARRLAASVLVIAASGLLAACHHNAEVVGTIAPEDYRARHPIVVSETPETMDVPVGAHARRLGAATLNAVAAFGRAARERGAGIVTIMVPVGSRNEKAAYDAARDVAAALRQGGVPATAIAHVAYPVDDSGAEAPVRISYPRLTAGVPHRCGIWPDDVHGDAFNRDDWEFGCATQTNLATIVADPNDFVHPRGMGPLDTTRRTVVLEKYRKGEKTKSDYQMEDKTASEVSK